MRSSGPRLHLFFLRPERMFFSCFAVVISVGRHDPYGRNGAFITKKNVSHFLLLCLPTNPVLLRNFRLGFADQNKGLIIDRLEEAGTIWLPKW